MKVFSTNSVLRLGFGVIIILMGVLAAVSLDQVKKVNKSIVNVVEVVSKKIEYASNMREAIRLRRIMLNKMVASNDVFERDEDLLKFYDLAGEYRKARESLIALPVSEEEKIVHEKLSATTKISQLITRRVLDRIAVGESYQDIESDLTFAIEEQAMVLQLLNELVSLQKKDAEQKVSVAKEEYALTISKILVIGMLILLVSVVITVVVTRYVSRQNEALIIATRSKSDFLAAMSHEIRTPLTAVIGFGETLAENPADPDVRMQAATSVVNAGRHLLSIVNDILDISKIEADRIEVEKIEVSLFDLIDEVTMMVATQAKSKGLLFDVIYQFPLPQFIVTDFVRLKQILINLCGNAFKFTEKGSVIIEVHTSYDATRLNFTVRDTGIGLSTQQLEKLFKPFVQADSSTSRKFGGTGLGLFLSRQLALKLGGDIEVKSQPGEGSEFTVCLNLGKTCYRDMVQALPARQNDVVPVQDSRVTLTGRVLVAEDTVDNQRLLEFFIRKLGAECVIASNGKIAVNYALNETFDLILMDWQMPEMDGLQAVTKLRQSGYKGAIVALTANVLAEEKERFVNAGCDEFLSKPINKIEFVKVLSRYLVQPAGYMEMDVRSSEYSPKIATSQS